MILTPPPPRPALTLKKTPPPSSVNTGPTESKQCSVTANAQAQRPVPARADTCQKANHSKSLSGLSARFGHRIHKYNPLFCVLVIEGSCKPRRRWCAVRLSSRSSSVLAFWFRKSRPPPLPCAPTSLRALCPKAQTALVHLWVLVSCEQPLPYEPGQIFEAR